MAQLLKIDEPTVNYSGRGTGRAAEGTEEDYKSQPPPDGYAAALEKRRTTTTH